jgi:hypothetical protein
MLESLRLCTPGSVGRDISLARWVKSIMGNVGVIALTVALFYGGHQLLVVRLGNSVLAVLSSFTAIVLAITAALYVYYVYIVDTSSSRGDSQSEPKKAKRA